MPHEMAIPRSRSETTLCWFFTSIVVFFFLLSISNLAQGLAPIASGIWILFVTYVVWSGIREARGLANYLTAWLGDLAGKPFVESAPPAGPAAQVRFGFRLFGHRFIREKVAIDRIVSVEWNTGQATSLAGHDMDDWHVCLWYVLDAAPIQSTSRNGPRKGQTVVVIGPSSRKQTTEALGRSFITFLRTAGVTLVQSEKETCFVRECDHAPPSPP